MSFARRQTSILLMAAILLAFCFTIARASVSPVVACTPNWRVEWNHTTNNSFWSNQLGQYDYLNVAVTTWYDGCGGKDYESLAWTSYGTSGSYYVRVRAWVCGTYKGYWASSGTVVWSPIFTYPWYCGRQGDNGPPGSTFTGGNNSVPSSITVYVDQG